ncbi:MAG TPA: dihydrolipoamide acetyltransferase family protein [Chloroflexota bacterium]|nr:dihydrolipoamide acetyltransferase family protein [Chloroflexota bacterium]
MATTVSMPQLGESVAEGTIGRLLKAPGDRVERDEAIVEVMTDKVNAEIPSPVAGIVEQIVVQEGDVVPVGAALLVIGDGSGLAGQSIGDAAGAASEAVPAASASPALASEVAASAPPTARESARALVADAPSPSATPTTPAPPAGEPDTAGSVYPDAGGGAPKRASPFVRSLARKYGINLAQVNGSGLGGRVTKDDILAFIEQRGAQPVAGAPVAVAPPAPPAPAAPAPPPAPPAPAAPMPPAAPAAPPAPAPVAAAGIGPDEELVPLTPMRRAIADHMVRSVQTAPHAWGMTEIDVSALVKLRAGLLAEWQRREGFELTYLPFFVKAVVEALRENPTLNARWSDQGVVLKKRVHIGIAVAVANGLVVPVVRDADQKSIAGLALAIREIVLKAREGRLTMDDLAGGTFTVNNTGALGSIASGPIINQPQAGIITMEAIVKRPIVTEDDAIAIRSMMNSCLSFDHRVTDGAEALRFLRSVKQRVEAFGPGTTIY